MSDLWNPSDEPDEADPEIISALRTMAPPAHGYGFWSMLDARLAAEAGTQAPTAPPPPPSAPPEPPAEPPLAEVVPLSPGRGPGRWLLAAAAALVAVAGIAAVTRGDDTKLETTPAAPVVTVETTIPTTSVAPPEPTSVPSTVPRAASTVPVAPGTSKPSASPTTVPRSTTTTRPGSLTLSAAGLGPLRLGMSPQQAAATGAMGRYRDADPSSPGSCGTAPPAGSYRSGDFTGLFVDNKLVRFYVTASSRLSTPQGISVGSPSSMIASVPGTRSEQPEPYGAGTNITVMTGGAGYLFTVSQGAITEWSVGTPAGLDLKEACS